MSPFGVIALALPRAGRVRLPVTGERPAWFWQATDEPPGACAAATTGERQHEGSINKDEAKGPLVGGCLGRLRAGREDAAAAQII